MANASSELLSTKYNFKNLASASGNLIKLTSDLFEDGDHYGHLAGQDLTLEMEDAPHLDDVLDNFPLVGILI